MKLYEVKFEMTSAKIIKRKWFIAYLEYHMSKADGLKIDFKKMHFRESRKGKYK